MENNILLPVPLLLQPWIQLNQDFQVLLCIRSSCQCAVSPVALSSHLYRKHQAQINIRKQVDQYVQQLGISYNYQNVPLPPARSSPQPILQIKDGFQCNHCQQLTQNRRVMQQHCNKAHNIKCIKNKEMFTAVRLQSWFGERRERYWVVDESRVDASQGRSRDENNTSGSGSGRNNHDHDSEIKEAVARWEAEVKERRLAQSKEAVAMEVDPWLRYTEWPAVIACSKHDLVKTSRFVREPDADETELVRALKGWSRLLEYCLDTLKSVNHRDALKWWMSPQNEAASQRPFELPQNTKSTLPKYSKTFQGLICYILRTAPINWGEETETGVQYTELQWQTIYELRQVLAQPVAVAVAEDEEVEYKKQDREVTVGVFKVTMSLVCHDLSQSMVYDSAIMHYLAVRGIDHQTRAYMPASSYTPILAQMLWMIRLVMLEITLPLEDWPEIGLKSRSKIEGVVEYMQSMRKKYLCEGSFSPASSILSQLARGKAINKLQHSPSNIHWSDDRQMVFFDGKGVAVAKIGSMCQMLIQELQDILHELLFHQAVAEVPLAQMADHMGSGQYFRADGYSFINHVDNAKWRMDWRFLYQRMLQDKPEWQLVKKSSGSGSRRWIDHRRHAYLTQERQFLRKLMVVMHVTGGQPARGPEIGSIKVRNNQFGVRSVYIISGRVGVLTTYDKSQKRRGKTEYVLRLLPVAVAQLLVQYLVYVLPFTRVVGQQEWDFLFADYRGPWIGQQLSGALAVATAKHLGVRLTMSGWRQVAIAIANEHLGKAGRIWEMEDEEEEDEDFAEGDDEAEVEQNIFQHILVRQAAHGQRVAQRHYAIDGAFLNHLGPALVNAYSQASRAWHMLLGLEGAVAVADQKRIKREAEQELGPRQVKRSRLTEKEVAVAVGKQRAAEGLKLIFGPNGKAQSEAQEAALELVHQPMKKTTTMIIVLPTGSGKTALFFSVAAMAQQQVVIVVVPFTALINDLMERASGSGIQCQEWLGPRSVGVLPQLVVVSADRAVQGEFLHFAKGLELQKQLSHIFFDECHVAFTDTSYRERLRWLWQLRYLDCPFICLTATLMTRLEGVLRANLLIENAVLFRWSTIRRTIRYTVQHSQGSTIKDGIELAKSLPLPPGQRGVIYVRSYATGEVVRDGLGCLFYMAQLDDKEQVLQKWADGSGSGGWIVATGALGTGINIGGIIYVLHIDRPYGLTSFMQQAGRGGREGGVSDSYIIVREGSSRRGNGGKPQDMEAEQESRVYSVEKEDEEALDEYLAGGQCRRAILGRHFDGAEVDCRSSDGVFCDWCRSHHRWDGSGGSGSGSGGGNGMSRRRSGSASRDCKQEDTESGEYMIAGGLREEVEKVEGIIRFMDVLKRHCIFCQLRCSEANGSTDHCHWECRKAEEAGCGIEAYKQWRSSIKLAPRGQCFRCGLADKLCRAVEDEVRCEYGHILLPGMWILQQSGVLWGLCRSAGFDGGKGEWQRQWQWLNQKQEVGNLGNRELNWIAVWGLVEREWSKMIELGK